MANPTSNFGWQMPTNTDLVKDLPADFEVFGQAVDTSLMDLKGGTTGQVLSKASNTDMDFTWVAQDDSNAIQNAIVDAKGDLISATAADTPARLAVGTNGQVLTADSTTATGLKWATAGGGANFTLLNAGGTSLSGSSTVTISGISGQNTLMIVVNSASHTTGNSKNYIQFNADTTATNYEKYGLGLDNQSNYSAGMIYGLGGVVTGEGWVELGEGSATGNIDGYVLITGCNTTNPKVWQSVGAANNADAKRYLYGGVYLGTSTISSVRIVSSSSNFDAGTIFVYGSAV